MDEAYWPLSTTECNVFIIHSRSNLAGVFIRFCAEDHSTRASVLSFGIRDDKGWSSCEHCPIGTQAFWLVNSKGNWPHMTNE